MNPIQSIKHLSLFERALWGGSALTVCASYLLSGGFDRLSLIASLVGVTALIFIAKGDVLGQLLTVLFSILYAVISWRSRYFGEMITYLGMTMPIAVLSVVTWLRNPYSEQEVKVSRLSRGSILRLLAAALLVTAVFYFILKTCGTANLPVSTLSITTSFTASSLMMLRSPYYALAYALNDIVLIVLWLTEALHNPAVLPMTACFLTFFINDLYGFRSWRHMERRQDTFPKSKT